MSRVAAQQDDDLDDFVDPPSFKKNNPKASIKGGVKGKKADGKKLVKKKIAQKKVCFHDEWSFNYLVIFCLSHFLIFMI